MTASSPQPPSREALRQVAGYLNFASGQSDPTTLGNLNALHAAAAAGDPLAGPPSWLVVQQWLRETLEERDIVLQEMRHRVKNLFTIINSIMRMERTAHDTADALADSLGARFKALSDAHEMIVPVIHAGRSEGATTTLDALLRKLLAPHGNLRDSRISMDGDEVPVGAKAAVYLTLALHELATNSAKYGGLSSDDGRLSVHWHTTDEDQVEICWEETGQRWDTDASPLSGFGSRLLLIAIEGQLAGRIDTRIEPDRFVRTLHLPLARLHA